ncbi:hypothetical protein VNO80_14552 [Phaseolus coccineus]|uniref:Uncharacterized protein n=1 Tax=Phaseolus coccineus TaxID=3886 RepID=A0AAN9MPP4_PHACN
MHASRSHLVPWVIMLGRLFFSIPSDVNTGSLDVSICLLANGESGVDRLVLHALCIERSNMHPSRSHLVPWVIMLGRLFFSIPSDVNTGSLDVSICLLANGEWGVDRLVELWLGDHEKLGYACKLFFFIPSDANIGSLDVSICLLANGEWRVDCLMSMYCLPTKRCCTSSRTDEMDWNLGLVITRSWAMHVDCCFPYLAMQTLGHLMFPFAYLPMASRGWTVSWYGVLRT